jgi:hypothetical protein
VIFGVTHPAHYRVMFGGHVIRASRDTELDAAGTAAFMALLDALIELQGQKRIRIDDPMMQARYIWGAVHGIVMLTIAGKMGPNPPDAEDLARFGVDRMTAGLAV